MELVGRVPLASRLSRLDVSLFALLVPVGKGGRGGGGESGSEGDAGVAFSIRAHVR